MTPSSSSITKMSNGKKIFECPSCSKQYLYKSSLHNHRKSCGIRYSCSTCERQFATSSAKSNHESKCGLKYECHTCSKTFNGKARLEDHINTMYAIKSIKCEI